MRKKIETRFVPPFRVKNVKAATFGLRSTRGETATAELVDAQEKVVFLGGLEEILAKAEDRGFVVENETEARYLAIRHGGRM